jgi:hypothetical protein
MKELKKLAQNRAGVIIILVWTIGFSILFTVLEKEDIPFMYTATLAAITLLVSFFNVNKVNENIQEYLSIQPLEDLPLKGVFRIVGLIDLPAESSSVVILENGDIKFPVLLASHLAGLKVGDTVKKLTETKIQKTFDEMISSTQHSLVRINTHELGGMSTEA